MVDLVVHDVDSVCANRDSPFPARDVAMIPGLLPIFFPGCEIKPGSGLGIRLIFPTQFFNTT